MSTHELLATMLFFAVLLTLVKPLGVFMARVYQGQRHFFRRLSPPARNLSTVSAGYRMTRRWIGNGTPGPSCSVIWCFS